MRFRTPILVACVIGGFMISAPRARVAGPSPCEWQPIGLFERGAMLTAGGPDTIYVDTFGGSA